MMSALDPRQRILRAIARRTDIDRVPLVFRAEPPLMRRLRNELHLDTDLAVLRHFGADSIQVGAAFKKEARQGPDEHGFFTDLFGNRFQSIRHGELESYTVVEPALGQATNPRDVERLRWPTPAVLDLDECRRKARDVRATGLAVYGGIWASLFTTARNLLGEEYFLLATIEDPDLVRAVVDRLTDSYLDLNQAYLEACRDDIDVYYFGSDLGTQRSLFMSPDMCRAFIFPNLQRVAHQAKSFGLPVMYHTCGAVGDLIDDLIACGVDCLDPVQVSATGMQPDLLAARFKGRIAFHGAISTQTTLPFGTPDEVDAAVRHTIAALGPAGLICGPDQEMIGQVPLANLQAMCAAIRDSAL